MNTILDIIAEMQPNLEWAGVTGKQLERAAQAKENDSIVFIDNFYQNQYYYFKQLYFRHTKEGWKYLLEHCPKAQECVRLRAELAKLRKYWYEYRTPEIIGVKQKKRKVSRAVRETVSELSDDSKCAGGGS